MNIHPGADGGRTAQRSWRASGRCAIVAAALALGVSLTVLPAAAQAQTAEQLEQQYGRDAMAQALDVKHRYDLYGIHFETGPRRRSSRSRKRCSTTSRR